MDLWLILRNLGAWEHDEGEKKSHLYFHSSLTETWHCFQLRLSMDFPGGTVNKNPPANAGDMGSILSLGRFHMPRDNQARVPHSSWACAPGPALCNQWSCAVRSLRTAVRAAPAHHDQRKPRSNESPAQPPVTLKYGAQNMETCDIVLHVLFMNTLNNKI